MPKSLPFSIYKRAGRRYFYVSFKNEKTGEYFPAISTRQESEKDAIATGFKWLQEGIPVKSTTLPAETYTLRKMAEAADLTRADAEYICQELRRRGFLETFVLSGTKMAQPFIEFLTEFWDFDKSPYILEKLRKQHSIHRMHCNQQRNAVLKYWKSFFGERLLGELGQQDIDAFINSLIDAPISASWKNVVIKAGTKPLRWAYSKGLMEKDITKGLILFAGKDKERHILSPEQAALIFRAEWKDPRTKVANMLAAVTGLRAGEILGLRVQDIGQNCLYIRHSWNRLDGLKTPKNNEDRQVELPFDGLIQDMMQIAQENPHGCTLDSFIFWGERLNSKPMEEMLMLYDLRAAMRSIGMGQDTAKTYTFHGWRHFYTSYMRKKVDEKLLQKQTGHKTLTMLNHYSDHELSGDRALIQAAQIETFSSLLPEGNGGSVIAR
jgi:integrase